MTIEQGLPEPGPPSDQSQQPSADPGAWDTREELAGWDPESATSRDRFCQHYLGVVQGTVRSHGLMPALRGRHDPEDLAQEAWHRVLAMVESQGGWGSFEYRGKGSFEAYLRSIVDKTIRDTSRREQAEKRGGGSPGHPLSPEDEASDPLPLHSREATPTERARISEQCDIARSKLTPEEFEVWSWKDLEGYSSVEIAAWVGKTPAAVRGILFRARDELRQHIEEE